MKHKRRPNSPEPSGNSKLFTPEDRTKFAQLLDAVPTVLHQLTGQLPKVSEVAELLGLSVRTRTDLLAARYKTASVLKMIHTRLTRDCPDDQQRINLAIRRTLQLDDILHKYFPAVAALSQRAAGVPPGFGQGKKKGVSSKVRQASALPDITVPIEILRLYAFAQGLDEKERARLEHTFACGQGPDLRQSHRSLADHLGLMEELLGSVARQLAGMADVPLDWVRAHAHVIGSATDRATGQSGRALLPMAYFSLIRSLDSTRPVFMDHDWYTIVNCANSGRTLVQTVDLDDRPDTLEAREVPSIACVLAHPLRHPVTDQVMGTLSFDCLAGEAKKGAKINPQKTLKALGWTQDRSEHPNATIKSIAQISGNMITKMIYTENLRRWVE